MPCILLKVSLNFLIVTLHVGNWRDRFGLSAIALGLTVDLTFFE